MELLGERLETFALGQQMKQMEDEEEKEALVTKLFELETLIGSPPDYIADDIGTSIWDTIASIL